MILFHYFWVYFTYLNASHYDILFSFTLFSSLNKCLFLLSTLVLTLYIDVVLSLSTSNVNCLIWRLCGYCGALYNIRLNIWMNALPMLRLLFFEIMPLFSMVNHDSIAIWKHNQQFWAGALCGALVIYLLLAWTNIWTKSRVRGETRPCAIILL